MSRAALAMAAAGARLPPAPAGKSASCRKPPANRRRLTAPWPIAPSRTAPVVSSPSDRSPSSRSDALNFRQVPEFAHHAVVNCALERHHELRDVLHRFPAPGAELRLHRAVGLRDVDFALRAGKAHRKPLLGLTSVFALPGLTDDFARDVVFEPVRDLTDALDGADIGFFLQLAHCRRPRL